MQQFVLCALFWFSSLILETDSHPHKYAQQKLPILSLGFDIVRNIKYVVPLWLKEPIEINPAQPVHGDFVWNITQTSPDAT